MNKEYVQLVVPQHLYDELGLHPNQTITLSRPQNVGEPQTHDNSIITAINSGETSTQYEVSLPTEPEVCNSEVEETKASSLDDKEFLAVVVSEGNGKKKLLTYQLKSTTLLSNSQSELDASENESTSNNSNDVDIPWGGLHAPSCDISAQSNSLGTSTRILAPSRVESHAVFEGKSVNAASAETHRVKYLNPMFCEVCCRGYLSKHSFRNHKKNCEYFAKNKHKKVTYPRNCTNCERTYKDSSSFMSHRSRCERFRIKLAERRARGEPLTTKNYPWYCTACNFQCTTPHAFRYHMKRCIKGTYVKNEINSYPRTCVTCNQVYFCSSSYLKHKQSCGLNKEMRASTQILESMPPLSSLESFCQMDASESDFNDSNNVCDLDEWNKDSCSVSVGEKPGKRWIPVSTDTRSSQKYFVVKKASPSHD